MKGVVILLLMPPKLSESDSEPLYLKIYHFYREHILRGNIPEAVKLPSIRALASHMGVSRNPVEIAYSHLVAEGYIENKPKSGYFPLNVQHFGFLNPSEEPHEPVSPSNISEAIQFGAAASANYSFPFNAFSPRNHSHIANEEIIDFAYDGIHADAFPYQLWMKLSQRTLREAGPDLIRYGDQLGELSLRRHIQAHVRQHRGVVCHPEQIIVTSGTQQSALLVGLLLRSEKRPLGVEAAMHPGLYHLFHHQLSGLVPMPIESDGMNCEMLGNSLCGVYVTPSHQFPYGGILSAAKRTVLLQWAITNDAWLIEDDYDSEFIFDGRPLPALQGMDRSGRVIYMGTFSKAMSPALRLSYLILPQRLLERFHVQFPHYDGTASRLTQATMVRFMEGGHLQRHIRKMKTIYKTNRKTLLSAISAYFGDRATVSGCSSGLHAMLRVHSNFTDHQLVERARGAGLGVQSVTDFLVAGSCFSSSSRSEFVLGYGALTTEQIEIGIMRLAKVWE